MQEVYLSKYDVHLLLSNSTTYMQAGTGKK